MNNPPPSQKPELPIWVWSLIGAGGTLLVFLAGYGIWSLTTSKSLDSSIAIASSVSKKSENTNPLFDIKQNGKYGFIDRNGKIIIAPQFDNVSNIVPSLKNKFISQELIAVSIGGKWGYINRNGEMIIQPQFVQATYFSEGLAWVKMQTDQSSNAVEGFIDKSGNLVIRLQRNNPTAPLYFRDGFANIFTEDGFRYIDQSGKLVFDKKFDVSSNFEEGIACVWINKKAGCIDRTGQLVILPKYDNGLSVGDGLVAVRVNNQYGYIDTSGEIVISPVFEYQGNRTRFLTS